MTPDLTYIKQLLDAFEDSSEPHTDITQLSQAGLNHHSNEFIFHIHLMADRGLVEREDGRQGLGYELSADRTQATWSVLALRLTAQGHDFAAHLREPKVVEKIKTVAANSGLSVWLQVAGAVATQVAKQALGLPG